MSAIQAIRDVCRGSEALTHGIRVSVHPSFRAEHSTPMDDKFVFSYRVRIANESDRRIRLLNRRWVIIDGDGETSIVEGEGVVGEQPEIEPGGVFEYSSWCPLTMRWGTMEGQYTMLAEPGESITVSIGRFFLVAPES